MRRLTWDVAGFFGLRRRGALMSAGRPRIVGGQMARMCCFHNLSLDGSANSSSDIFVTLRVRTGNGAPTRRHSWSFREE